ncbi:MAG: DNA polymerase III subunit delta [Arenimonas sp.]
MELKPERFERQLAGEALRPVYLIAGTETLIVQELADAVRLKAKAEGYGEREVFEAGRDFDWNELAMGLAALSLFSSRRLFDLRLPSGRPDREGSQALQDYCNNPPPDTVLLVTTQDWSSKHAGKWSDAIARAGVFVPVWPVRPNELPDWLEQRLRTRGFSAEAAALQLLAERVEGNLLAAAQEVDKIALLAPAKRIGLEEMESLVADSARYDVFKLVESAFGGNLARARRMLASLRAEGEQVPALLPIVAMELLKLAALARAARAGNLATAMREARVWDSKQALYRRALERHDEARCEAFVAEAGRIDLMSKGRLGGDAWLALERLLAAVASVKARALLA